jgi:hypothetical protein
LGERLVRNQKAVSSILITSTNIHKAVSDAAFFNATTFGWVSAFLKIRVSNRIDILQSFALHESSLSALLQHRLKLFYRHWPTE